MRLLASCLLPFSLPGERYLGSPDAERTRIHPDAKLGHPELHHPHTPGETAGVSPRFKRLRIRPPSSAERKRQMRLSAPAAAASRFSHPRRLCASHGPGEGRGFESSLKPQDIISAQNNKKKKKRHKNASPHPPGKLSNGLGMEQPAKD